MSTWAVRLYDAEDRLLVETKVSAETYSDALDAARAFRWGSVGDVRQAEIEQKTTRLLVTRVGGFG